MSNSYNEMPIDTVDAITATAFSISQATGEPVETVVQQLLQEIKGGK